jgi:hypothetical protein
MISLEAALLLIMESDFVKLVCVRSQGTRQGTIYTKYARYGSPDGKKETSEKKAEVFDKKEIGERFEKNEYFSPNIYHILSINDQNVKY